MKIFSFIKNNPAVFAVLGVIALQNPIWLFWKLPFTEISFIFCILLFFNKYKYIRNKLNRIVFPTILLFGFFVLLPMLRGGIHGSSVLYLLCYVSAFCLTLDESKKVLEIVSIVLGSIIAVSLPAWLIHQIVFQLPVFNTIDISFMKGGGSVIMENYLFFVQNPAAGSFRFYCVFDEPGVMGTIGAYLLYHNRYELKKWYNLSILLGCLCSMSMAFYALTAVGLVYTNSRSIKTIIATLLLGGVVFYFSYDYLKSSEDFNNLIVGRFLSISDKLDGRTNYAVNAFYDNMSTQDFLFGIGEGKLIKMDLKDGASYKLFIIENGFLALLALFYAYFRLNKRNTMRVLVFVALFWLSFLQRPTAYTGWQMLVYASIVISMGGGDGKTITHSKKVTRYIQDEKSMSCN